MERATPGNDVAALVLKRQPQVPKLAHDPGIPREQSGAIQSTPEAAAENRLAVFSQDTLAEGFRREPQNCRLV